LVVLQEGGTRAPLFCFDPTGTHVQAYKSLAYALGDEQPVYGLALSHIFATPWQEISINRIAEDYAQIVLGKQPKGPYYLLGWSNGGAIALAVARVLERHGQSLAFLGILDSLPQAHVATNPSELIHDEFLYYFQGDQRLEFLRLPDEQRQSLYNHLLRLDEPERVEYAIQWAQDKRLLPAQESDTSIEVLKVAYALTREAGNVLRTTARDPVQAPIHAWWTSARLSKYGKAPIDWTLYTKGTVEIRTIHGDHTDAVQSIQVHQRISEILTGKQARGGQKESYGAQS
jgi:thioesterase domain-containing protein